MRHIRNFFDGIKERKIPVADVPGRSRSANSCHIVNIAMRLGRQWSGILTRSCLLVPTKPTRCSSESNVNLMPSMFDCLIP